MRVDPTVGERQIVKLDVLRADRDSRAASGALDRIQQAAAGDENLLPLILDAVKVEATLGEISDAMRAVWGEHREHVVV